MINMQWVCIRRIGQIRVAAAVGIKAVRWGIVGGHFKTFEFVFKVKASSATVGLIT